MANAGLASLTSSSYSRVSTASCRGLGRPLRVVLPSLPSEEVLRPERGPDLAFDVDLIGPGVPPGVRPAGRHDGHIVGAQYPLLPVDPHGQGPGDDFEPFLLVGMDVGGSHESAGLREQLEFEELTAGVLRHAAPDHPLPRHRVLDHVARSRHDSHHIG
jgi:hypothetical protein